MADTKTTRLKLADLSGHLVCVLCGGYLIDATTITECLHSFCRTCLVRHFQASKSCPRCQTIVHKTKPLLNLRQDRTLQTLVYKLVPGLFQSEMKKRRTFYAAHPNAVPLSEEDRGNMEDDHHIFTEDDKISLCLTHCDRLPGTPAIDKLALEASKEADKRYLLCPALVTVAHLKKFIRHKFDLSSCYQVEIVHTNVSLKDACTLMDIANIYSWKRVDPLRLSYIVFDKTKLSLDLPEPSDKPIITTTVRLPPAKKKPRKAPTPKSPKSPKVGLVKSKRFKPPRPKAPKSATKKVVPNLDGPKPVDITNNDEVAVTSVPEIKGPLVDTEDKLKNVDDDKSVVAKTNGLEVKSAQDTSPIKAKKSPVKNTTANGQDTQKDVSPEKDCKVPDDKVLSSKPSSKVGTKKTLVNVPAKLSTGTAKVIRKANPDEDGKKLPRVPPLKVAKSPGKAKIKCASSILRGNDKSTAKWLNMLELKTKESDKAGCKRKDSKAAKASDKDKSAETSKEKTLSDKSKSAEKSSKSVAKTMEQLVQKVVDKQQSKQAKSSGDKVPGKPKSSPTDKAKAKSADKPPSTGKPDLVDETKSIAKPKSEDIPQKSEDKCETSNKMDSENKMDTDDIIIVESNSKSEDESSSVNNTNTVLAEADCQCDNQTQIPEDCQKNEEEKVPSPSVSPAPLTKIPTDYKDTESDMDTSISKELDMDNQPDVVRSSQRSAPAPCSNCGHTKNSNDKSGSPKVATKEGSFSKSRSDVITRPADTSNPQLDVDSPKLDKSEQSDTCPSSEVMDTSSTKGDSVDIANRASPASVCSMTIGQSGMAIEEASRSPISESAPQEKESIPVIPNKTPPIMARGKKTSARDKAKSINSIIKRIEERNQLQQTAKQVDIPQTQASIVSPRQTSTPQVVNTPKANFTISSIPPAVTKITSQPTVANVPKVPKVKTSKASKASKTPPGIHPAFASAMAAQGILPTSLNQQMKGLPQHPVGMQAFPTSRPVGRPPTAKRERSGNARGRGGGKRTQSPGADCTPIKRMRQMCNGIVDNPGAKAVVKAPTYPGAKSPAGSPLAQYSRSPQQLVPGVDPRSVKALDPRTVASMSPRSGLMNQAHQSQAIQNQAHQNQAHIHAQMQARAQANANARSPHQLGATNNAVCPAKPRDHYSVPPAHMNSQRASPTSVVPLNGSRSATPISNMHPAHSHGYKSYFGEYSAPNPRANGYDEPLELTTKPPRERQTPEEPRGRGSYLKIPSLVKP